MKISTKGCTDALHIMLRSCPIQGVTLEADEDKVEVGEDADIDGIIELCHGGIEISSVMLNGGTLGEDEFEEVWAERDGFKRLKTRLEDI